MLDEPEIRALLEAELNHAHYWTDDWDPVFYVQLACAGFISTGTVHPEIGPVLIPELQTEYAVLDHEQLHLSRNVKRILRSGRLEEEDISLQVSPDCSAVLDRLIEYHGESTWLSRPYCDLIQSLSGRAIGNFRLRSVALHSKREDHLIAGELGYTIGQTYTSLSGFSGAREKHWRDFGTLQLVLLAQRLRECGYAFWNLGHPHLEYKQALGAKVLTRADFLNRWHPAVLLEPDVQL